MKYSSTLNPSRKFDVMGRSMISPDGFAINPRIPASCFTCCRLPRAPESTIRKTGFNSLRPSFSAARLLYNTELLRHDLVKDHAAGVWFDVTLGAIAVNGFLTNVRVLKSNPVVRFYLPTCHCELHFSRVREERQT